MTLSPRFNPHVFGRLMGVCALVVVCLAPQKAHAETQVWRVQSGEILSRIAVRFGVSVRDLREWNDLSGDRIVVGQALVVSPDDAVAAEPEPSAESTEQVEPEVAEAAAVANVTAPVVPEVAAEPTMETGPTHAVRQGETLTLIASAHDTTVPRLIALNPRLDPNRLHVGDLVRVDGQSGQRIDYRVRRGDSLSRIAQRHRVRIRDILRWNPRLRSRNLIAGRSLRIWSTVPESTSESIGATNHGRLVDAERLPRHPGYMIRDRNRAYGTLETVLWMRDAFDDLRDEHPGAPRVRVHDISNRRGGRMRGHRSHQSGRDVDISYYQKRCGGRPCAFRRLRPNELDAARQWTLMRQWLSHDRVEAIFMDYSLQRPLYEEAQRRGASRGQLRRWFQYPRGRRYPLGLIRHFPKHRDHLHVRFVCPDTDEECR